MNKESMKPKSDSLFSHAFVRNDEASKILEWMPHTSAIMDFVVSYVTGAMVVLLVIGVGVRATNYVAPSISPDIVPSPKGATQAMLGLEDGDSKAVEKSAESSDSSDTSGASPNAPAAATGRVAPAVLWALLNQHESSATPMFNGHEALRSIERAARTAGVCLSKNDPRTATRVAITFDALGRAKTATVDEGPFVNTAQGACIARIMRAVSVPTFAGPPVTFRHSFRID